MYIKWYCFTVLWKSRGKHFIILSFQEMAEGKRSSNFSAKEETILLSLVKQYITILENKKTDSNINKNKLECWKQIENQIAIRTVWRTVAYLIVLLREVIMRKIPTYCSVKDLISGSTKLTTKRIPCFDKRNR